MKIVNKIVIISLIFSIILYTVCRIFFGENFALGILAGSALSMLNLKALAKKITGMLEGNVSTAMFLNTQVRLLLTGAVIALMLTKTEISVIGLLVGLSVVPVCIPVVTIYNNSKGND